MNANAAATLAPPERRSRAAERSGPPIPDGTSPARPGVYLALSIAEATVTEHRAASSELLLAARERVWSLIVDDESCVIRGEVLLVRLRRSAAGEPTRRIDGIVKALVRRPVRVAGKDVLLDVGSAWRTLWRPSDGGITELTQRATDALPARDLARAPRRTRRVRNRSRADAVLQVLFLVLVAFALPLFALVGMHVAGVPIDGILLTAVVAVLVLTIVLLWVETVLGAIQRKDPPEPSVPERPLASAIIAAYLPNEQHTIVETVRAFLAQEYRGGLQVILAYNTDRALPVEQELRAMAEEYPKLTLARVDGSTSKAQNVNAAVALVRGAFVGIFDADHHPAPGAFERAWRWLADGVEVVQGHCVVRNGDDSWVSRTVAVEFEQIYAVSHPGRARLHGYGIFGGSNGYWQTDLLRTTRMRGSMLTEDIDSSLRAVRSGARIHNDPALISTELAPTTLPALWRQRMRWTQGWSQVAIVHGRGVTARDMLTTRQRAGMFFHLLWREAYPFLSALIWPLLAFYLWRDGGLQGGQPALLVVTVVAWSFTPMAVVITRRVADPRIAARVDWWWWYVLLSALFYQELKNVIARLGVIKLVMGDRRWTVTTRSAAQHRERPATSMDGNEFVRASRSPLAMPTSSS